MEAQVQSKYFIPKREGFFRLAVGGSSEADPEQYQDVDTQEIKECNDFCKDIFKFCKEVVQETVREQGYEFVHTGKGSARILKKIG